MQNRLKWITYVILFFSLLIVDFISKRIALMLEFGKKSIIIPNLISFEKVYNTGAAFGIFNDYTIIITLISIIITLAIIIYLVIPKFQKNRLELISFIFIMAGAIGNIHDRIFYSYVIDFIKLEFINFPVFNFADICINIGVLLLITNYLFFKNDTGKQIHKN